MKEFEGLKESLTNKINDVLKPLDLHIYELNNNNDFDSDTLQVLVEGLSDPMKPLDLDLITTATESVNDVLDSFDKEISDPYALEVSSAGIEKPILSEEALQKAIGNYVHVDLAKPDRDVNSFEGTIESYDKDSNTYNFKFFIKGAPKKRKYAYKDIKFVRYAIKF